MTKYKIGNAEDIRKAGYKGLLYRDYIQAMHCDALYAVSTLTNNKVNGGTRFAVYTAIDMDKPVYVWDVNTEEWYM